MPRSPSAAAHRKVLAAAVDLIAAQGIDATSMDAIARTSGVSKATIYKHWFDKDALILEVMAKINGLHSRPSFDSGDTRADLIAVLAYRPEDDTSVRQRIQPHFLAYAARHNTIGQAWRNMVMNPPRRELRALLEAGIARHELDPNLDFELALALLLGPVIYWYVFLGKEGEPPQRLAREVVDAFWRAFALPLHPNPAAR